MDRIDFEYSAAVRHVRAQVEIKGTHWEKACDDALVHFQLGLTQIADLYRRAAEKYNSQSPRSVDARDKGKDEDVDATKA